MITHATRLARPSTPEPQAAGGLVRRRRSGPWLDHLCLAATLLATAATPATGQGDSTPAVGPASRTVSVGVLTDNYPFSFTDDAGVPTGYAVDLLAAVQRVMGLRLERVTGSTTEINGAFVRGDLDMLQSYAEATARQDHAAFSVPYLTMAGSIFTRRDVQDVVRLADLRGRRVAVHRGSLGERLLLSSDLGDAIVHVPSVVEAFEAVAAGHSDATLASRLTGLMAVDRLGLRNVVAVGEPVAGYDVRYCFAVRPGEVELLARLNEGLAVLERTGEARDIYRRWFSPVDPPGFTALQMAVLAAACLAVALMVAVWSIVRQRAMLLRLRRQESRLAEKQKLEAIGTLSSGIAHDFNNILMAVVGNAEAIRFEVSDDSPLAPAADDILAAAGRAQQLVGQILTFSRRHEPRRRPVALAPLVQEALRFLRATTPANIAFDHRAGHADAWVLADPIQVHQVLMNVGTNAVHAMRDRGGCLQVEEARVDIDRHEAAALHLPTTGSYARITIRDCGCGMPADVLARVFDPFFSTKGPGEGTGLGLAVVRGVMSAHEGAVSITSEPGVGTEARLYLPLTARAPDADTAVPAAATRPSGRGRRAMVIDDEPAVVQALERILRAMGFEVLPYVDARAGLAAFDAEWPAVDLVITDLSMPGLSGLAVLEHVRTAGRATPVVLTSGYLTDEDRARARALGVSAVLQKPVTLDGLSEAIAACDAQAETPLASSAIR